MNLIFDLVVMERQEAAIDPDRPMPYLVHCMTPVPIIPRDRLSAGVVMGFLPGAEGADREHAIRNMERVIYEHFNKLEKMFISVDFEKVAVNP